MDFQKPTILVVDDTPENIDVLTGVLRNDYNLKVALNGKKAIQIMESTPQPEMVLLDIMMPEMDGYEVCKHLKSNPATSHIPIIFVTAKITTEDEIKGLSLGAVDYITKPISPPIVQARVRTHLALHNQNRELYRKVAKRTQALNETRLAIIQKLGKAAEFKDNETGLHVIRMSHYSRVIAEELNISEEWTELVFNAAPMHDIGKIGIADHILLKPGKLDTEEWQEMQRHCEYGAEILGNDGSDILSMAQRIALTHHEKWNGNGYPDGISGEDIPIESRIVAIADVFDALTSERPYKKSWPVEDAVNLIKEESGSHFDPKLVEIFLIVLPKILIIKEKHPETVNY